MPTDSVAVSFTTALVPNTPLLVIVNVLPDGVPDSTNPVDAVTKSLCAPLGPPPPAVKISSV